MDKQITDTVLMVRPRNFGFNPETAENNAFQSNETSLSRVEISQLAIQEFDTMVDGLRNLGVTVIVIEDTSVPVKTDAVFPNNWFTTHSSGELYLFPMFSPNRQLERRPDIVKQISEGFNLSVNESIVKSEAFGQYLEGTGSMILDRTNKLIYACYSERTHPDLLSEFADVIGYKVLGFYANDKKGIPYYHTNVIMALGTNIAIICTESIINLEERSNVIDSILESGKDLVEISRNQVLSYAGNMLELRGKGAKPIMVMSTSAYNSLTIKQQSIIEKHNNIFHTPLPTIEKFGGGSARCMLGEIFKNE